MVVRPLDLRPWYDFWGKVIIMGKRSVRSFPTLVYLLVLVPSYSKRALLVCARPLWSQQLQASRQSAPGPPTRPSVTGANSSETSQPGSHAAISWRSLNRSLSCSPRRTRVLLARTSRCIMCRLGPSTMAFLLRQRLKQRWAG